MSIIDLYQKITNINIDICPDDSYSNLTKNKYIKKFINHKYYKILAYEIYALYKNTLYLLNIFSKKYFIINDSLYIKEINVDNNIVLIKFYIKNINIEYVSNSDLEKFY